MKTIKLNKELYSRLENELFDDELNNNLKNIWKK
jgi:hypothetical protein